MARNTLWTERDPTKSKSMTKSRCPSERKVNVLAVQDKKENYCNR